MNIFYDYENYVLFKVFSQHRFYFMECKCFKFKYCCKIVLCVSERFIWRIRICNDFNLAANKFFHLVWFQGNSIQFDFNPLFGKNIPKDVWQ